MSSEKARFFLHVYFHYENKEKHIGDAKFGNDTSLSAPLRALREYLLGKYMVNILFLQTTSAFVRNFGVKITRRLPMI